MKTLDRRSFFGGSSAALGGVLALSSTGDSAYAAPKAGGKPVLMKLGTQEPTSEEDFVRYQRYGVNHVCGWYKIKDKNRHFPTVEELKEVIDLGQKYDISIDMTNCNIGRGDKSAIMLGTAGRDKEIEDFQTTIKNCAAAGIPIIKYYLSILPIVRLAHVPGRGDTFYNRWNYAEATAGGKTLYLGAKDAGSGKDGRGGLTRAGHVDADTVWERMTYFLDRVIPVANEYKIKLAQHPHDPGLPPQGFMGAPNVLGTVDGLKRFLSIRESPYHGLNFCQGTMCEMLEKPKVQIMDAIHYFGSRKKIFNVHFRNIRGHRNDFVAECFPDDGEIDMQATVQAYRDVGYDGMLMPDHVPVIDPRGLTRQQVQIARNECFVFAYGYIRGLIQNAAKI